MSLSLQSPHRQTKKEFAEQVAVIEERAKTKAACDRLHRIIDRLDSLIKDLVNGKPIKNGHDG